VSTNRTKLNARLSFIMLSYGVVSVVVKRITPM
jgi:hypothetical protein